MENRLAVVYDNDAVKPGLKTGWGFSVCIEYNGFHILFDTGNDGDSLLYNLNRLNIDPEIFEAIVISHGHLDHTGGLDAVMSVNKKADIYLPQCCSLRKPGRNIITVGQPVRISAGILSLGELKGIEQSLAIEAPQGILIVTGCSHPGVDAILDVASKQGKLYGIIGGLHVFSEFELLRGLRLICPCHCTVNKEKILTLFPQQCTWCGAGFELIISSHRAGER